MRQWFGPALVALALAAFGALALIASGVADLAASEPHPEGWARLLHFAFDRSTALHARGVTRPADLADPARIAAGAAYYGQVCAHCHSGPGLGQNPVALAMHPRPQYLVTDLPAARFSDAELFRIVKGGVKYSAMPSWPADKRDDEVWHVVAFLKALPAMRPDVFRRLAFPGDSDAPLAEERAFGPDVIPRPYAMRNDDEPPRTSFSYRTPVLAFGRSPMVDDPVVTCAQCHGANGAGRGVFPNLTILDRTYLARTLAAFAHGRRQSGYMRVVASGLSPRQIGALAAYYDALPRKAFASGGPLDDGRGAALVIKGDPRRGIGACVGCHGITRAAAKAYPVLEGQNGRYLANQLRLFKDGGRGGLFNPNPMIAISRKLADEDVAALARYYAAQPPALKQTLNAQITAR